MLAFCIYRNQKKKKHQRRTSESRPAEQVPLQSLPAMPPSNSTAANSDGGGVVTRVACRGAPPSNGDPAMAYRSDLSLHSDESMPDVTRGNVYEHENYLLPMAQIDRLDTIHRRPVDCGNRQDAEVNR